MKIELDVRVFLDGVSDDPGPTGDPIEVKVSSVDVEDGTAWVYVERIPNITLVQVQP